MIRLVLLLLSIGYLSLPAYSQAVQLRSGEHETFSRLTLPILEQPQWSVKQSGAKTSLSFSGTRLDIDVSQVFERMPKSRISSISWNQKQQTLELDLLCQCSAETFWFDQSLLVIDIVDETDGSSRNGSRENPNTIAPKQAQMSAAVDLFLASNSSAVTRKAQKALPEIDPDSRTLQAAREKLVRNLGRAVSQDLLSPRLEFSEQKTEKREGRGDNGPTAPAHSKTGSRIENLSVRTSIDQDFLNFSESEILQSLETHCLPDNLVDVTTWGSNIPFVQRVAELRSNFTGEFDVLQSEQVTALAKLYIHYGFGAEALAVLATTDDQSLETKVLRELAQLAENGFDERAILLADQLDCEGASVIWSALSYKTFPTGSSLNEAALLRGFNSLPVHLRNYFGPKLAQRLLDAGYSKVAEQLFRIIERPEGKLTTHAELVFSQSDISGNDPEATGQVLTEIVNSNTEHSADALVEKIDNAISSPNSLLPRDAELAAAFAFEYQSDPEAEALAVAEIKALAASDDYESAIDVLRDKEGFLSTEVYASTFQKVWQRMLDKGDDVTLLSIAFRAKDSDLRKLQNSELLHTSERLHRLGFSERANAFINSVSETSEPQNVETLILKSEITLEKGLPRQALVYLLGVDTPAANALRADAFSALGQQTSAAQFYGAVGNREQQIEASFLAGDWESVLQSEDKPVAEFAEFMQNSLNRSEPNVTSGELAENKSLLESSRDTRTAIRSLIDANTER